MQTRIICITIGILTTFIALTAIGGGVAILAGADRFPPEWLHNTPFDDYTIPARLLAIAVGGSALVAVLTVFIGREVSAFASMAAGLILAGYIIVEVVILKQVPAGPTPIEFTYFGLGLAIFGLGATLYYQTKKTA
jgi:hypothetical protein